jgi:hypothetical protein
MQAELSAYKGMFAITCNLIMFKNNLPTLAPQ